MKGTSVGMAGGSPSGASPSAGSTGSSGGISEAGPGAGLSDGDSGGMSGSGIMDMDHLIRGSVPEQRADRRCVFRTWTERLLLLHL